MNSPSLIKTTNIKTRNFQKKTMKWWFQFWKKMFSPITNKNKTTRDFRNQNDWIDRGVSFEGLLKLDGGWKRMLEVTSVEVSKLVFNLTRNRKQIKFFLEEDAINCGEVVVFESDEKNRYDVWERVIKDETMTLQIFSDWNYINLVRKTLWYKYLKNDRRNIVRFRSRFDFWNSFNRQCSIFIPGFWKLSSDSKGFRRNNVKFCGTINLDLLDFKSHQQFMIW